MNEENRAVSPKTTPNKLKSILAIIIFTIILVIAVGIIGAKLLPNSSNKNNSSVTNTTSTVNPSENVSITVTNGNDKKSYNVKFVDNESAFDLMKRLAQDDTSFAFGYKESDFGPYITSLNGVDAGTKQFWKLVVNGKDSEVGAQDYKVQKSDKIEWILTDIKS